MPKDVEKLVKGMSLMAKIKNVEKRIWDVEGFAVQFLFNGKDVRGDKEDIPQYPAQRKSKGDMTVNDWKNKFKTFYPGFDVRIIDGNGNVVRAGQLKLENLRATYVEENIGG